MAGGASVNLQLLLNFLELRADDGIFVLVVETKSGFTKEMINELLSVASIESILKDLSEVGSDSSVKAVVQMRGDEGLESREESLVEDVTQAAVLIVVGFEEVGCDVGSPEEGLHERHNGFGLVGFFAVQRVLVVDLAGDGAVDIVGDLVIWLVPGAQGNAGPEGLGRVANKQKSESSQTDLGLFSLVEEDGHQQRADNVLLLVGQVGQCKDSLSADNVAEGLIFPILSSFSASAGPPGSFLSSVSLIGRILNFDPFLSHFLL